MLTPPRGLTELLQRDFQMEVFPFLQEAIRQRVLTHEEAFLFQTFVEGQPWAPLLALPQNLQGVGSRLSLWQSPPANQLPL